MLEIFALFIIEMVSEFVIAGFFGIIRKIGLLALQIIYEKQDIDNKFKDSIFPNVLGIIIFMSFILIILQLF